jgi:hypothetical protein
MNVRVILSTTVGRQWHYLLAGDSAYPISYNLIKPYSNNEAEQNHAKWIFNARLSGLRTVMSENVYGIWKRRFPCLSVMRSHVTLAKKTIYATAILHYLSILWNDAVPDRDPDIIVPEYPDVIEDDFEIVEDNADAQVIRLRGQILRDQLSAALPL